MSAFAWDEKESAYVFQTESMEGCLVPLGHWQGIHSLVHREEGRERVGTFTKRLSAEAIAAYGDLTGTRLFLLDLYHYMAREVKQGPKGRDMPTSHRLVENGVEIQLQPVPTCNVHTRAVYTINEPDKIDLEIQVTAEEDYRDFELWLSSYTPEKTNGAYYHLYDGPPAGNSSFFRPEENDFVKGFYLAYPRDNHAAALTYDGRWGNPDYQTFLTGRYYAQPIVVVLNEDTGFAYIEMSQKQACCKVCGSYSATGTDPETLNDYTPFYQVLFGCDISKGQTLTARVRACLVKMDDDFEIPLELYREFSEKIG